MQAGQANTPPEDAVARFVERLTGEQRMLIVLKRELYQGCWDSMLADLQARLQGKPYVFKLAHRIGDDIARIEGLLAYEQAQQVDLADYVNLESLSGR